MSKQDALEEIEKVYYRGLWEYNSETIDLLDKFTVDLGNFFDGATLEEFAKFVKEERG